MKKAIIFGASGQDGIYMKQICEKENILPITVARSAGFDYQNSVGNLPFVEDLIRSEKPEFVFHFAANSTTRHEALFENHDTISTGTLNILENVKKYSQHAKVLITGSGVQFENKGKAISENTSFRADNAYAIARIQSVYAARYFRSLGIHTYVAYLFHHESPYRHEKHISKMITNKIKDILNGSKNKIKIGDASVEKEWAFAKDIVEGIFTLVNQDVIYEATVGTGVTYSILEFLEECFRQANLEMQDHVVFSDSFKAEYPKLVSDPSTIHSLGWKPKTELKDLVEIMLK